MTLDQAWTGVMITYTEQDFPTSAPYQRTIPGWECTRCRKRIGTSGPPPLSCPGCGQQWNDDAGGIGRANV